MGNNSSDRIWRSAIPFEMERIHAAAVYCSDGRWGEQFDDFLHNHLGLPRYDRLAVPGGAACLAGHPLAYREEEAALEELRFLVEVHGLERVVLIAHQNCAYYLQRLGISPESLRNSQAQDLAKAARRIKESAPGIRIDGYLAQVQDARVGLEPVGFD